MRFDAAFKRARVCTEVCTELAVRPPAAGMGVITCALSSVMCEWIEVIKEKLSSCQAVCAALAERC